MQLLFVFNVASAFALTSALASDCDKSGILIYEDLGCTPEYDSDKTCPKKYSCKGLEPSTEQCIFRGKTYTDREKVDSNLTSLSCDEACLCTIEKNEKKHSGFNCAILDCPEWLGVPTKINCYRKYSLDHCCSIDQMCPPFDNIAKCVVEGKEYREGEKFSPTNTCLHCVCQKGFQGKFEEPFCKKRLCGAQLRRTNDKIQQSCAPFYSKQFHSEVLCCPDHWICPDGSESVKGDRKLDETCKFGSIDVKVGQYIEKKNITDNYGRSFSNVICECLIPPLVKCRDK